MLCEQVREAWQRPSQDREARITRRRGRQRVNAVVARDCVEIDGN
jgi:hypothetical protein